MQSAWRGISYKRRNNISFGYFLAGAGIEPGLLALEGARSLGRVNTLMNLPQSKICECLKNLLFDESDFWKICLRQDSQSMSRSFLGRLPETLFNRRSRCQQKQDFLDFPPVWRNLNRVKESRFVFPHAEISGDFKLFSPPRHWSNLNFRCSTSGMIYNSPWGLPRDHCSRSSLGMTVSGSGASARAMAFCPSRLGSNTRSDLDFNVSELLSIYS